MSTQQTSTILTGTDTGSGEGTPDTTTEQGQQQTGAQGTQEGAAPAKKQETTQEGQQAEGQQGDQGKPDDGAPADIELTLPEGVEADPELLDGFRALAKESGLKGESAQKVVDLYVQAQQRAEQKAQAAWEQRQQEWLENLKADKDIGGAKWEENKAIARRAMARFSTPELDQFLDASGFGNHPEMVKLAIRLGKAISEDSIAGTSASGSGQPAGDPFLGIYTSTQKE